MLTKKILLFLGIPSIIILAFIAKDFAGQKKASLLASNHEILSKANLSIESNSQNPSNKLSSLNEPLVRAGERVTKKPFGTYITSQNSPIQPERFQGYHTGADFEILPEELNSNVSVMAITDGKIVEKRSASGYGGVLVESAVLNGSSVTIIYGHLSLASIKKNVGDQLSVGEKFAILGKNKSSETDGERKHLHLGIHKGSSVNILGYVASKDELVSWVDPVPLLPSNP